MLEQSLPAHTLGEGGPNGIQFSAVSAYFPVPPGQYDLQLVDAGASSCATGLIPTTHGLPALVENGFATLATVGDVDPTDAAASLTVVGFLDDATVQGGQAALRVINALPSVAHIDLGTGSLAAGTFSAIVTDVAFGAASTFAADGGPTDPDGYATTAPVTSVVFSAHPTGVLTTDAALAPNVSLHAGSVTTMGVVQRKNLSPQIVACTDDGAPLGSQSPCTVFSPTPGQ